MDTAMEILSAVHELGQHKGFPVTGERIRHSLEQKGIDLVTWYLEDLVKKKLLYKEEFEDIGPDVIVYMYQLTEAGEAMRKEKQPPLLW